MIFSAPIFLYLLPAAGLPVLFHFFLKQKKRQILFPTLMFFYRTDPRLNSRRKIHQLLLLLMRVLLIAFILLALSRPSFQSTASLGGEVSVVAVVDNSGSMSETIGNDKTKLELAVEGAKKLVSSLGDSAKMNVVTLVDDPAVTFSHTLTSDRESLLSTLDEITPTAATGDADRALAKAFSLLEGDSGAGGVVHVFSDLQESEWGDEDLRSESAGDAISVYFHRIESPTRSQPNIAISSIQFPRQKILPKHPAKVGIVCRNDSEGTANIRLNSIDDQDNKHTQNVTLEPGQSEVVEIETNPDAAGQHWIRTWIEGDGFSADNEAGIGVLCQQTATVLFSGSPGQFGVLPTALSPDDYGQLTGLVSKFGSATKLPQASDEKPVLVVTTWQEIGRLGQSSVSLEAYVKSGGNLLVVPSVAGPGGKSNIPSWLGTQIGDRVFLPRGTQPEVLEKNAGFWDRIRQATETISLEGVRVFNYYPLQLSEDFTPLFGADSDRVIFADRELGKGNIYVSGTAFDPRWTTLPLTGLVVVMAQSMATGGESFERDAMLSLVAGESPKGIDAGQHVEVLPLIRDPNEWEGWGNEVPVFAKPGAYKVKAGDREYCISVRSSDKEGLEQFVKGSQIPALERLTHMVADYDPADDMEEYQYGHSRTVELFLPLVLLATLALLAEGWAHASSSGPGRGDDSALGCLADRPLPAATNEPYA
ncbi:MAG: VWA domain-containing protein [Sedimentisphaerales bacterium]